MICSSISFFFSGLACSRSFSRPAMASSSCDTREFDRAFAAGSDRRHASAAASAIFFSTFLIGSSIFLTWSRGMCPIFSQRAWMLANAFLADSMSSRFSASISRLRAIFFSRFALWLISISASSAFFAAKMASPAARNSFHSDSSALPALPASFHWF